MKKHFFFFLFLISSFLAAAQTYNYIGVEDGLSNRRVYAIQKGPKGYMWFLTHDGIDRYNGKEFKHYKLMDGEDEINSMMNLNWLYSDSQGRLWEIGKQGRVFCYESKHDRFQLVYKLPKSETEGLHTPVSYGFIDDNNIIWLCNQRNIYLYNSLTKATVVIKNEINESITDIEQIDETHYFIGTDVGVHYAELKNNVLALSPCEKLDTLRLQINELFFHKGSRKIFIGTFQRGIYVYDLNLHKAFHIKSGLIDVSINRICTFGEKDILIATDGAGVYKMDVDTYRSEPYIVADFNRYNAMNGNTIYDIYVDNEQRIWMANYPIGIPLDEQKKLFKMHFRGSNAINSKVTGSGIGLLLVWKLVHMHKGKLNFTSTEGKGSCIKVSFPKGEKRYRKAIHRPAPTKEQEQNNEPEQITSPEKGTPDTPAVNTPIEGYEHAQQQTQDAGNRQKILIVEDNDELREYLRRTLAENYHVQVCSNGKSALCIVKEYFPDLIISDIMMPEMRGDELCQKVKNDIDTSHIPVILLTALNTDKNIIDGLQTGVDEYVVKPFNIGILRATIANLLANRALLRHRYGNLELNDDTHNTECINCSTDLDWKFIASIKKNVEDNMDNPSFTIDVLCTLLNMSRTSFYNKLKALTDQAPGDYVRLIRLKRAMQLLKEQKYTITEVAEMTGFSDAKYFREVFKKHFNISPSQYAKEEGNIGEGKQ